MPGGRYDETEQHLPPTTRGEPDPAVDPATADARARALRKLGVPLRWLRSGVIYQAVVAVLVVAITTALLTSGSAPAPVQKPDAPLEIAVSNEGVQPKLVYPTRRAGTNRPETLPAKRKPERDKAPVERRAVARSVDLAPQPAAAPAPAAPVQQPAERAPHKAQSREHRKPSKPEEPPPPVATRTLFRLTKPNGRYFFTIDPITASNKAGLGWNKAKVAYVWGDWQPGMKGLVLSDGTEAYVFLRKKGAPAGVQGLFWAGGDDGPYYSLDKTECETIGDATWYGYVDPI